MPDYKELFYRSQAEIADITDILEKLEIRLKSFMAECEEIILDDSDDREKIINLSSNHLTNPKK